MRELQNTIERAVILSDSNQIQPGDLNFAFQQRKQSDDGLAHVLDLSGSLAEASSRAGKIAEKAKIKQSLAAGFSKDRRLADVWESGRRWKLRDRRP